MLNRDVAVLAVFPEMTPSSMKGNGASRVVVDKRRRASAEATTSRAIVSLERKGFVVREVNPTTRRVFVRSRDCTRLPDWEEIARAEEDMGAHCKKRAAAWTSLAHRLSRRASAIRAARSLEGTDAERQVDLDEIRRLEGG